MKARRTRTIRWVLVGLLFGFLALTGLTLAHHHHHRAGVLAQAHDVAVPTHGVPQHSYGAPLASIGDNTLTTPAGKGPLHPAGELNAPPQGSARPGVISTHPAPDPAVGESDETAQQNNRPRATSGTQPVPQSGSGEFAYNGYVPLDCELPAGCGVPGSGATGFGTTGSGTSGSGATGSGATGSGTSGSGTSASGTSASGTSASGTTGPGSLPPVNTGGVPVAHDSQGPTTNQQTGDSGQGSDPPVASAPELDPATLAAAVTLLLGSLAVLRSRRIGATLRRQPPRRVSRQRSSQ
jgi:hypothetical protein